MTRSAQDRTLVLVRHGDAATSLTEADIHRPLTDLGRRRAHAVGGWLVDQGLGADLVLCSPAVRAQQTCEQLAAAGESEAEVWSDQRIYNASADMVLDVVQGADDSANIVVVVGHSPGLPALASLLCDGDGDLEAHERLMRGFPTATAAVLRYSGPWSLLSPGQATLVDLFSP
ncbi:phosphohistidine phosphatase SixA [Kribbia dieselivorans]|uniref:phosphohistidine phosphatase SixA n=1 Tax=Kribbia dieselivorans TaxID=331526 RepID=UPI000837E4ED|nr:phosphohistidine phosphatase SixA [Kribbia dieselivorans]